MEFHFKNICVAGTDHVVHNIWSNDVRKDKPAQGYCFSALEILETVC